MKRGMEPKLIKEETSEKEAGGSFPETPRTRSAKANKEARCKTPDSPEGARQAPASPNQSSHPSNGPPSPTNGASNDSLTPPLPASTALSVNLEGVHPQLQPLGSFSSGVTRPLVKVKRFLSTLVQFGSDIGPDIGERVKSLVLNLVSSNLSIEEFHQSLQEVTNFPLRPFVLPLLRSHLPLLQREIHAMARSNKQSTLQYVRNHEHVVLDPSHSPSEMADIFLPTDMNFTGIKRKASESIYENGYGTRHPEDFPPVKRPMNQNPFFFPNQGLIHVQSPLNHPHLLDYAPHALPNKTEDTNNNNRGDEEWKNIHVMLNCILSMVEKTKRALSILQQRNSQDITNDWFRKQDVSVDLKKAANEIMIQAVRQTEDRVAEVKKRAEEAVNDVKRQAVIDLQKAVAAAESKANELIAVERAKMEKLISESRKTEENQKLHLENAENSLSPPVLTQPSPSQQNACWNCGRKAHETCSGCGIARYCGSFCQHKDWENHHQLCNKEKTAARAPIRATTPNTTTISTTNHVTQLEPSPKFKK
ncbi:protein CBFA2T1 isoform X2 [Coccinella septempunctata]|uniref:protein CBFA2T1 isoform X2 n=1 Tax=Coccinella septempunctata TaxID=41139 RepID=UPI001D061BEA|nr:protein CBFA2T1 isoform X2 [Coccinella septempunctata]